ncbi:MAG: ATP-dependent helicase, partial [Proteobacteria bacterium]|nr:ATP-dependent helicase [Pseudomonadota bacterium]
EDHSLIELPVGMPKPIFKDLKKVWVCGRQLNITRVKTNLATTSDGGADKRAAKPRDKGRAKAGKEKGRRRTPAVKSDR